MVVEALTANSGGWRAGADEAAAGQIIVAHALTGEGHDASEDGTGRGAPLAYGFNWQSGGDVRLEIKEEEEGTLHTDDLYQRMVEAVIAQNTDGYPALITTDPKSTFETPALFERLGFVTYLKMSGFHYMVRGDVADVRMKLLAHDGAAMKPTKKRVTRPAMPSDTFVTSLPATVTLCARLRDGSYCLGQMFNKVCIGCGDKNAGVLYVRDDIL